MLGKTIMSSIWPLRDAIKKSLFFYIILILFATIQLYEPVVERSQLIKKNSFDFPETFLAS